MRELEGGADGLGGEAGWKGGGRRACGMAGGGGRRGAKGQGPRRAPRRGGSRSLGQSLNRLRCHGQDEEGSWLEGARSE